VSWSNSDHVITEGTYEHVKLLQDKDVFTLHISEVKLLDTSLYTCTASNEHGEVSCSADILVMPNIPVKKISLSSQPSNEGVSFLYEAIEDYTPDNSDSLKLQKGNTVQVLDRTQTDRWLVQCSVNPANIGFADPTILQEHRPIPTIVEPPSDEVDDVTLEIKQDNSVTGGFFVAIGNFEPKFDKEIALSEGTIVEVVDGKSTEEYWVVRIQDGSSVIEGLVPSTYLERKERVASFNRGVVAEGEDTRSNSLKHREKILSEMLKTEETYVHQLTTVVESHMLELAEGQEDLPPAMKGKSKVIFSNIQDIQEFHANALCNEMIAAGSNHNNMAKCFINHVSLNILLYPKLMFHSLLTFTPS